MDQFITVPTAAKILGVGRRRAHQLVVEGHLEVAGRAGRAVLLRRADVERLARKGWPGRLSHTQELPAGLLTQRQAAELLGLSPGRVRQLSVAGVLPRAGRHGQAVLLHRADVERLARERRPGRRGKSS